MVNAEEIGTDVLIEMLRNGTDGLYYMDAATRLLSRHRFWLEQKEFRRFVQLYDDGSAGIWFERAATALDEGALTAPGFEESNVLRAAASIATFYRISLRDVSERLSPEVMRLVAEAFMEAGGYAQSTAAVRL